MTTPLQTYLSEIRARVEKATDLEGEEWRSISEYHEVSNMGRVRSWMNPGNHKNKRAESPRLSLLARRNGYPAVAMPKKNRWANVSVHTLVMEAFVGPRPRGMDVAHLNGIPSDNRLTNLKYCTRKENESHKVGHGTAPVGVKNGGSKLEEWEVEEIRFLFSQGFPRGKIADLFGINRTYLYEITDETRWPHVPSRTDIPRLLRIVERAVGFLESIESEDESMDLAISATLADIDAMARGE